MGLDATGWTPTSAGDVIAEVRAGFDSAAGQPLDYSPGTWEGGATTAFGVAVARVEADAAVILDALSPETASGGNLDRIGAFRGLPRRAATRSRYIAYPVILSGYPSVIIPEDTQTRDVDRQIWQTVATQTVTSSSDEVAIEAYETGPIAMDDVDPQTLQSVTPVAGLSALTYDPGDADVFSIGRDQETDAEYRVRLRRSLSLAGGSSAPGVRSALLDLDWMVAVDVVRTAAGTVSIYVIPGPVGADQTAELAEAISESVAGGIATAGTDDADVDLPGGEVDTVYWTPGTEVTVTVAYTLTLASGTSLASVSSAVQAAAEGVIAATARGQRLTVLQMLATVAPIAGINGAAVLLNGSASDVVVTSTQIVVLSGSVVVA